MPPIDGGKFWVTMNTFLFFAKSPGPFPIN